MGREGRRRPHPREEERDITGRPEEDLDGEAQRQLPLHLGKDEGER